MMSWTIWAVDIFTNLSWWYFQQFELLIFSSIWAGDIYNNVSCWYFYQFEPMMSRARHPNYRKSSHRLYWRCFLSLPARVVVWSKQNFNTLPQDCKWTRLQSEVVLLGAPRFLPSPTLRSPIVMMLLSGQKQAHKQIQNKYKQEPMVDSYWPKIDHN